MNKVLDRKSTVNDNELSSEGELMEKVTQDETALSTSMPIVSREKVNIFDWGEAEEDLANRTITSFGRNMMGIDTDDLQEAIEFRRSPTSNENYQEEHLGALGNTSVQIDYISEGTVITKPNLGSIENDSSSFNNVSANRAPDAGLPVSSGHHHNLTNNFRESNIEALQMGRAKTFAPHDVIRNIVLGKPYSFESFKSLKEKLELLKCSVATHDGNAITAVLIFLKKTLKPSILVSQLKACSQAMDHFAQYLETNWDPKAPNDLQLLLNQDAKILKYRHMCELKNPVAKLQEIKALHDECRKVDNLNELSSYLKEEICLLEKQLRIDEIDNKTEKKGQHAVMRHLSKTMSVLLKSLVTTMYYCSLYHFDKTSCQYHPLHLKQEFKLNDKQYEWTVLQAHAKLHRWSEISEILTATTWLKKRTDRSHIGFDKVAGILHASSAPLDVIEKYVRLIDNPQIKLKMATLCNCHDAAIDTILALRDKHELEKYRQRVIHNDRLRLRITSHLSDMQIRWR